MGSSYSGYGTRYTTSSDGTKKMHKEGTLAQYIEEYRQIAGNKVDNKFISDIIRAEEDLLNKRISSYDTGGYTGSWGPDGKLAVLHQKEIVLNAADTSNLLASVDLLHNILQVIDVQSMTRQLSGILSSPQFFNNNSQTLEQQVYIEAHFPDATDRNELEAAFNNIINQASQYANRK